MDWTPKTADRSGLPTITNEGSYLTLTVSRSASATDVTFTALVSGDLRTWNFGPALTTVLINTPTLYKVRDNVPINGATRRFIRRQVSHP